MSDTTKSMSDTNKSGWLPVTLRALVHVIAAMVFVYPLTRGVGVIGAGLGAQTGVILGMRLAQTRMRSAPLVASIAVVGATVAMLVRYVALDTTFLAASWGPGSALRAGDAAFLFVAIATLSASVRAAAVRRPVLASLEVIAVGLAFAQLVVAHRHGAINRPFEVSDPIIAAGGDPTHIFLWVGGIATAVVVLLLMSERRAWRGLLHLAAVSLLLFLFLGASNVMRLPEPPPPEDGLGLRPQDAEPEEGEGDPQGGNRENQDELEFRDNLDTSNDRVPVGVVLFHDDYSPPYGVYYFRQGAFSQYNGRRLVSAVASGVDADIAREFPTRPFDVRGAPAVNANRSTVETTVALLADHTRPFGLEAPIRFSPSPNPDPERFRRTYRVSSAVLIADFTSMMGVPAGSTQWTEEQWDHYTSAPGDPRYADLTQRVLHSELPDEMRADPAARVAAITSWLGQEGTYSLRSRHAGADDPTADFLFGDKTGYCVHFAHAATYMLRAAGVPARVATGYAIEEAARQGGSALLVSGEASHAWPEVYFEGYGWVVADVTPQTVISPPPAPPDPDLQRLLGELARGLEPVPLDEDAPLPAFVTSMREVLVVLGWIALGVLVFAFLFLSIAKLWRALVVRFSEDQTRVTYRAALDRLSELAVRRERGESREAFARRAAKVAPTFESMTQTHVGAAFGSELARVEADQMRGRLRQVEDELAQQFPLWRRAVGRATPWSWLRSR